MREGGRREGGTIRKDGAGRDEGAKREDGGKGRRWRGNDCDVHLVAQAAVLLPVCDGAVLKCPLPQLVGVVVESGIGLREGELSVGDLGGLSLIERLREALQ